MNYEIEKFYREHEPLDGSKVNCIPFRQGNLYGFVDKKTKKWVIEPKFSQVYAVYAEGAIVADLNKDNKKQYDKYYRYGLTNYSGKWIIPPYYSNLLKKDVFYWGIISGVSGFNNKKLFSSKNFSTIFNKQGKVLFQILANRQKDFVLKDTLAWFMSDTLYFIYNKRGDTLKRLSYAEGEHFLGIFNNLLVYFNANNAGITEYIGKTIKGLEIFRLPSDYRYDMVFKLNDTFFGGFSDNGLQLMNNKGEVYPFGIYNGAVGFGFEHLLPYFYSRSFMIVSYEETKKMALLAKDGTLKLPFKYTFASDYHNGEIAYLDTDKKLIGFVDTNGRIKVAPFLSPYSIPSAELGGQHLVFEEDLCLASIGHSNNTGKPIYGYYNRQGKIAIQLPDSIVFASHFYDGLAAVVGRESKRLGFIDRTGKLVISMKYSLAVQGAYPFPEIVIPKFINGYAYLKAFKGYIDKDGYEYFSGDFEPDEYNFSH